MNAQLKPQPQLVFAQHEIGKLLPAPTKDEFQSLIQSIADKGQIEAGYVYEGKILDGFSRYRACQAAGIVFEYDTFKGTRHEATEFVYTKNLERRHLTTSQKACVAVQVKDQMKMTPSEAAKSRDQCKLKHLPPHERKTSEKVASMFGISSKLLNEATTVRNKNKKLFEKCLNGEMKVSRACDLVRPKMVDRYKMIIPKETLSENIVLPNVFESLDTIMIFHKQLLARGYQATLHACKEGWACKYTMGGTFPIAYFKSLDYCPCIRSAIVSSGREALKL